MALIDEETIARHVASGAWITEPLREIVRAHAGARPDDPAIVTEREQCSWRAYEERATRLAVTLAGLCPPSARVAVLLPDGPAVHVAYLATEMAGLVAVGIGPRAGDHEIAHLMSKTGATVLVTHERLRDRDVSDLVGELRGRGVTLDHVVTLAPPPAGAASVRVDGAPVEVADADAEGALAGRGLGPDDLWLLNSTSGTTGLPKCVTQFQNRWHYFHVLAVEAGALTPDDVFMSVVPAPFGFGLWTAHFTPTFLGAPVVVLDHYTPERMIETIERERVSVLACVSTQFVMLLNSDVTDRHDLTSLRVMFTGGEAVPAARAAEFEDRVGAAVLQFYGSNETGALSRTMLTDTREQRYTTAGRVIEDMQVRLLDPDDHSIEVRTPGAPGQPACKGPATCAGYYDDDAANRELYTADGWMLMGDICTIDADGYLEVVGRTSDIIIRGGKNISAVAVEQEVATHPAVRMAAAVAMPDPVFGERVCVFVELADDQDLTLDALLEHLRVRGVSREWWPERLEVRGELPRSSGQKIAKGELRKEIEALVSSSPPD